MSSGQPAADRDGASAAKRRRERRLRQFLRHERLSVAMALAAAQHHSAPKSAGPESYEALRGQNTAKAGKRPGVLTEPEPQGGAVTVGYVAAPGPLLVVASLAGGDEVDTTTVFYLLKAALEVKKKEEEEWKVQERKERVMRDIHRKIHANEEVSEAEWAAWRTWHGIGSSSSSGRRKRKKKRKKKLPKSSSSCGRARRRQRQWHDWISSNDEICADYFFYFRFKLKGKGRSVLWEVFLFCDKTIKVDRDYADVLPLGVPLPDIGGVGFGSSPYLATDFSIYELCLPSVRCMGMSMILVDPVSSGKYCGTCVSTAPAADPAVMSFTVLLLGSTIVATAAVGITCFASADCTVSRLQCAALVLRRCRGDGSFTPDGVYDSLCDSVKPITGEYTINFFQYLEDVGCVHAD